MSRRLCSFISILLLAVSSIPAYCQMDVYLRAERAGGGRIPIAVRDIQPDTETIRSSAGYITSILRNDLKLSGLFQPVQLVSGTDSLPEGETAVALLEGFLRWDGKSFHQDIRLLDFTSRELIFHKRYRFGADARRSVAHHICDEIVYFMVGERGIARTRILFRREGKEGKDIHLVDYDGFGEKRLTTGELTLAPMWMGEGLFCYTSYLFDEPECYLVNINSGERKLFSGGRGVDMAGDYHPGNKEIVMTISRNGNSEIFVLDPGGKILRQLTRNRGIDCSPSWAPNGKEVVFVSDRRGTPQIYIMDRYGGNLRRLTRRGSYNTSPSWSPRGDVVVYVSREGGLFRLKLISPDGLMEETVFDDYLSYEDPAWAPDGRHLVATVKYGGKPWLVVINVETGEKRRLVQGQSPAWSSLPAD